MWQTTNRHLAVYPSQLQLFDFLTLQQPPAQVEVAHHRIQDVRCKMKARRVSIPNMHAIRMIDREAVPTACISRVDASLPEIACSEVPNETYWYHTWCLCHESTTGALDAISWSLHCLMPREVTLSHSHSQTTLWLVCQVRILDHKVSASLVRE